jgi:hypothetical protein
VSALVVATQPSSLVAVDDQCARVEMWAESCDSIPDLQDANNKLGAIDEYLSLTATEGRARVAAARRRLEVRIGTLLGEAKPGPPQSSLAGEDSITPNQRHQFRQMAQNPEAVEAVIEDSTDEAPASRAKVLDAIKPKSTTRRGPLPEAADRAGWEFRKATERIERIAADDRFAANREQVAASLRGHLSYAIEVCQDLLDGFDTSPQED